jgi:hypothetical protein
MSAARMERCIHLIRGQRIMLDADLAPLYGVSTRVLTQAVRRNRERFPGDFLFQLVADEVTILRSQTVISSLGHGGRRYRPYAFTEQGIAMLSSVLRSRRAIRVNVEIMRAFVRLRRMLAALERTYDGQFKVVFDAMRKLMSPPEREVRPIGFRPPRNRGGRAPALRTRSRR